MNGIDRRRSRRWLTCCGAMMLVVSLGCSKKTNGPTDKTTKPSTALKGDKTGKTAVDDEEPCVTMTLTAALGETQLVDDRPAVKVWAYNNQIPGPVIRVKKNQRLRLTLKNLLPQPTTIHWHGVRVPNAMDGVPGVTQPPVKPGESFVYDYAPRDAGTFWFHPHVRGSEQVERGLYGVLVVEEDKPEPYDQDIVWVLDDWRLARNGQIDPRFNTRHDLAMDGRWGNVITVNGRTDTVLHAKVGQRIRLRLVVTANGRIFAPKFAGLLARGIAIDGMNASEVFDPNGFELAPGNRMDVDLLIRPQDRGKSFAITNHFTRRPHTLATIQVADEVGVTAKTFAPPAHAKLPDWSDRMTRPVDLTYKLNARRGGKFGISWTINDKVYGKDAQATMPKGKWVKVRYENLSFRLHPMHMHGVFFRVLARNGKPALEPHWRDTVLVHRKEIVDIALIPNDVGRWALHCHILEHAESGMMTVFKVAALPAGDAKAGAADKAAQLKEPAVP